MAVNRSARSPGGFTPFRPRGVLAEGRLPVAQPDGSELRQAAGAFDTLARNLGGIADIAAATEGERAGTIAGGSEDFRPTGGFSIRGRAYDRAGIESYLNRLDANLRTDMQSVFEATGPDGTPNRENPAALKAALDGLAEIYRQKHVFPEIGPKFEAEFARGRLPYQNKALENFDTGQRQRFEAELLVTSNELATQRSRLIAAVDPSDPAALDAVAENLQATGIQYDRAVAAGVMSPAAAAEAKIEDARAAQLGIYRRQAEALENPDDVAGFRASVRTAHAEGRLGLDAQGYEDLQDELTSLESSRRTSDRTATNALEARLESYVERVADGVAPPPEEWPNLRLEAERTVAGPELVNQARKKLIYANIIRKRPLAEAEAAVAKLRAATASAGTAEAKALLDFANGQLTAEKTRIRTDLPNAALRRGLVPEVAPIVLERGAETSRIAGQVAARIAQVDAAAAEMGVAPRYLSPGDVSRIREMAASDLDSAATIAGGLVAGGGPKARQVLGELQGAGTTDAMLRSLSQAGYILAAGGDARAAREVLLGARPKPETGDMLPDVEQNRRMSRAKAALGDAFIEHPDDGDRVKEAARSIARVRLAAAGVDPNSAEAENIYAEALVDATGALRHDGVQYGGLAAYDPGWLTAERKTIAPPGVKADSFRDVVLSIRDGDLGALDVPPENEDGSPVPARQLHGAIPVPMNDGYAFALGDPAGDDPRWIRGRDGEPFVLPFEQLEPMLRARVPGAFLGE